MPPTTGSDESSQTPLGQSITAGTQPNIPADGNNEHRLPINQSFRNLGDFDGAPNLAGRVKLEKVSPVFHGAYSLVYKGTLRDQPVAIKVLKEMREADKNTMQRKLRRERTVWARLRHRNIFPLYGFADDHEIFQPLGALISPWRQKGDASRYLKACGEALTKSHRLHMWRGVVAGVEYLHNNDPGIVHGDLKSANILIDDLDNPQLCDFGLVSIFPGDGSNELNTTSPFTGTDRYLSYELVGDKEESPTTESDIYALGCVGLEFYFLRLPHADRNNRRLILDIRSGSPPATRPERLDSQREDVWNVLDMCWRAEPSKRPTARQLRHHWKNRTLDTPEKPPLIYLDNIPAMGFGYRACVFIPKGTLVLEEAPAILLPRVNMTQAERDAWIQAGVAHLQHDHFAKFALLQIARQFRTLQSDIGRFLTNALPCEEDTRHPGLFLAAARFNTSCRPNVHQYWNGTLLQFRTTTNIKPMQELLISNDARDLLLPTAERRARILQNVGYQCQCVACLQVGAESANSDTRRCRIKRALEITNHTLITKAGENFHTICDALQDLHHEGLYHFRDTLLYDGYQVCRAAGDGKNAVLWLQAAYQAAVVIVGGQNRQVQQIGHLLQQLNAQELYLQTGTTLGSPPHS